MEKVEKSSTRFLVLVVFACLALACGVGKGEEETLSLEVPPRVPNGLEEDLGIPSENPMTAAKVELGKLLFFDPRLSRDFTISCATCHNPALGFTDGLPTSTGIGNQRGNRNAPTVINTTYHPHQFWDGRAPTLEAQALGPIQNPIEMGNSLEGAVKTIGEIEGYRRRFQEVFGGEVTAERIAMAIATFERTVLSGNTLWDRFNLGETDALTPAARGGWELFRGRANCTSCHVGSLLTDFDFHNLGVGMATDNPDLGRFRVTGVERDRGAFKTPTLREIGRTAPYMHDGSLKTIREVIDFYDRGGEPNRWLDRSMQPLHLSANEKVMLQEFLLSLEGEPEIVVKIPRLPDLQADPPEK